MRRVEAFSGIMNQAIPDPHVTPARKRVWYISNVGILGCAESACSGNCAATSKPPEVANFSVNHIQHYLTVGRWPL